MPPFIFKEFTVAQQEGVFKVGTDAVVLGVLAPLPTSGAILEVGAGTGVVSLMMAQRCPGVPITAIEIDAQAARLAAHNIQNSKFLDRIEVLHTDVADFSTTQKFGLILSNPPYFSPDTHSTKLVHARQTVLLDFKTLASSAVRLLAPDGQFCIIIPADRYAVLAGACEEVGLYPNKITRVFGRRGMVAKRVVAVFRDRPVRTSFNDFIIEDSPRVFSEEYLSATAAFHKFK